MIGGLFGAAQPALGIKSIDVATSVPPMGPGRPEATAATVVAAPDGIVGKILALIGLGSTTTFEVTTNRLRRTDEGKTTRGTTVVPVSRIATVHFGSSKPVALLVLGVFFVLSAMLAVLGHPANGAGPLIVGVICLGVYFTSGVTYLLVISSVGGTGVSLKVKSKDPADLNRLAELVQEIVRTSDEGGSVGTGRTLVAASAHAPDA